VVKTGAIPLRRREHSKEAPASLENVNVAELELGFGGPEIIVVPGPIVSVEIVTLAESGDPRLSARSVART
jgi:hypothetical protein